MCVPEVFFSFFFFCFTLFIFIFLPSILIIRIYIFYILEYHSPLWPTVFYFYWCMNSIRREMEERWGKGDCVAQRTRGTCCALCFSLFFCVSLSVRVFTGPSGKLSHLQLLSQFLLIVSLLQPTFSDRST